MQNYIIFDLEWNQSSGGKEKENIEIPFEILEIGAIKVNKDKKIIDTFSSLIKPQVYSKLHYMTKKLIHIEIEDLKNEKPFKEVMTEFLNWCGKDPVFCTWGTLDLTELQKNMKFYQMNPLSDGPFSYLDIQKLFSLCYEDGKQRRTLEYAVDYLSIEKDEEFHRALSDAYYTAKVFQSLNNPEIESHYSIDVFHTPNTREEEIHVVFDNYSKYISREFKNKTLAMADREVASTRCYLCGKNAKKKIRWFAANSKHYYCVAYCNEHGFFRAKARMKKSENGNIYVVKTIKKITEEEANKVFEKQEKVREQRKIRRKLENSKLKEKKKKVNKKIITNK